MSPCILQMGVDAAAVQRFRYGVCRHAVPVKYNQLTVKHQLIVSPHVFQTALFIRTKWFCAVTWKHHRPRNRPFSQWGVVLLQVWGWKGWTAELHGGPFSKNRDVIMLWLTKDVYIQRPVTSWWSFPISASAHANRALWYFLLAHWSSYLSW